MSEVKVEIDIEAPPDRVWDAVMDPDRLGDWVTIHRSVNNVSARPLTRGATMEQVMAIRGVTFKVNWKVVQVDRPHSAEWEGHGPARSEAKIRYELAEHDGRTRFGYVNEFTPPGGRLGHVASRVIVGAASEREAHRSLSRLKALVERDGQPR